MLSQLLFLSCNNAQISSTDTATTVNNAFENVGNTLKLYSEMSTIKKVSEVSRSLSSLSTAVRGMTGPIGAVTAFVQLGVGNIEAWR